MDLSKYRSEDFFNVLHEINRTLNATMNWIEASSNGNLDYWVEFMSEINTAHVNLEFYRRKKIDAELNEKAEEIRRNMF